MPLRTATARLRPGDAALNLVHSVLPQCLRRVQRLILPMRSTGGEVTESTQSLLLFCKEGSERIITVYQSIGRLESAVLAVLTDLPIWGPLF